MAHGGLVVAHVKATLGLLSGVKTGGDGGTDLARHNRTLLGGVGVSVGDDGAHLSQDGVGCNFFSGGGAHTLDQLRGVGGDVLVGVQGQHNLAQVIAVVAGLNDGAGLASQAGNSAVNDVFGVGVAGKNSVYSGAGLVDDRVCLGG